MSYDVFKKSMLAYMSNQNSIKSYEAWSKKFTLEYDMLIRRGGQIINKISVEKGNTELMEQLSNIACLKALQVREGQHTIINDLGKAIIGYWTGATLNKFPIPIIPAVGSFQNIATNFAIVTYPGKFPNMGKQFPTNDIGIFLDQLILGIQGHLFSLKGFYITTSLYPGVTPIIGPGFLQWEGYQVTVPATPSRPSIGVSEVSTPINELLNKIPDDNNTVAGAAPLVAQVGSAEILSDDGQDAGPQINAVKRALSSSVGASPPTQTPQQINAQPNNSQGTPVDCGNAPGLDYNMQLSPNYQVRSLSLDVTFPHKIKSQVGLSVEDIVCNLQSLAQNIVEPLRAKYPNLQINSAFRGTASLSGGRVSQHQKGEAIDVQFKGVSPREYLPIAQWVIQNLPFDQIIFEHGKSIWLHISHKRGGGNRKSQLTMLNGAYEPGIKCYY